MAEKQLNPIQSGFLLTKEEKIYLLVTCALFILGLAARYLYLNNRNPSPTVPAETELIHE